MLCGSPIGKESGDRMTIEKTLKTLSGNSHPEKTLRDHLQNTFKIAQEIKQFHELKISVKREILTHDVAKSHPAFQKYLYGKGARFPHSEPSSKFTLLMTRNLISAECVRRHHSCFEDFEMVKSFWLGQYAEQLVKEINEFVPGFNCSKKQLADVDKMLEELLMKDKCRFDDWYKLRLKASLLSTADRMEAMNVEGIQFEIPKPILSVEAYIKTLPSTPLSEWRQKIREQTVQNLTKITTPGIYRISLPTGAGKTLIALETANQLKKKTIIYALPFISIIDQTAEILHTLYEEVQTQHHMTEVVVNDKNPQLGNFVNTFNYWFSPVVITTFVSLWKTLFSPKYTHTMNFHRLKDSVIILDEIQSIPSEYFTSFIRILRKLCGKLNMTILLMTATMPGNNRFISLSKTRSFPHQRHAFLFSGEMTQEQLLARVNFSSSGMIVLNTKRLALNVYRQIKEKGENVQLLSKWIIPAERIQRIIQLKTLEKQRKKRTLVTTQLVEAGVDLDFQYVLRDLSPLDSIIQTAGRCNRHLEQKKASVEIFMLKDANNRYYADYIYNKIKLNCTINILNPLLGIAFDEKVMNNQLKKYYAEVFHSIDNKDIYQSISSGEWGRYFPLIEKKYPEASLIVDIHGEMKPILDELMELPKKLKNLDRKKELWKALCKNMIDIPKIEAEEWYLYLNNGIIDDEREDMVKLNEYLYYCAPSTIGKIYGISEGFIPFNIYMEENNDDNG